MKMRKTVRRRAAVLASALSLALPLSTGTAGANTSPGRGDDKPDVRRDCNTGKAWTELGKHQAGTPVYNCAGTSPERLDLTSKRKRGHYCR